MDKLSIPSDRLFLIQDNCYVKAETLLVPSVPFIPSKSPALPHWLKNFLYDCFLDQKDTTTPQQIYISRSQASIRRITNEQPLIEFLQKRGFAIFHLEEMDP